MSTTNSCALNTIALYLLAACAALPTACSHKVSTTSSEGTPILSGPPNTTYPMPPRTDSTEMGWILPDGQREMLADHRGQVLVLDFYATWCVPCRKSIPHLGELQRRFGPQGLQVVGLNVGGADDRVKVASFARELAIQYPLGFPDKALTDLFLADDKSIPQTFLFDRKGQLLKRFIGYDDSTRQQLEQVIQSALVSDSK